MRFLKRFFVSFVLLSTLLSFSAAQEQAGDTAEIIVTGVVYDAVSGQPLAFADISCPTFSSAFSDIDGVFSIPVRSLNDFIIISSSGYHTQEVVLAGRSEVAVYMQEGVRPSFQQEVNFGDFAQKKAYTPRAVTSVNMPFVGDLAGKDSPESVLGSSVPGLKVNPRSGIPGVGADLFIRGRSSLNTSNAPLIIVDGMIYDINAYGNSMIEGYTVNSFAGIEVDDIESFTVLKDAAAIYGAKAANGVILINTIRARQQATTIDFKMYGGVNLMPETYPLLDGPQYKTHLLDMLSSAGPDYSELSHLIRASNVEGHPQYYVYNNNTDWQKEVFDQSNTSAYRLGIKGGDDVALYALSVGFMQNEGVVNESKYSRFNLRFNSDIKFSEVLTLNSNIAFAYHDKHIGGTGAQSVDDVVTQARIKAPFLYPNIRNEEGYVSSVLADYDSLGVSNPVAILDNQQLRDVNYRFFGSFNFNFQLNDYFQFSNLVGLSFDKDRESIFIPSYGVRPQETPRGEITNQMKARVARHMALNNDFRMQYTRRFGYEHGLNVLGGVRINLNDNEEDWGQDYTSANDMIRTLGNGLAILRQKGGYLGQWNSLTTYLSGDYDYLKRYFLHVSMSVDGSSRFGKEADGLAMMNSVFGFFPSVSAGWLLTSEPFMQNVAALDLLKLRVGYGVTGNDDIGNFSALKYYTSQNLWSYQGIVQGNLYNPSLKWETNTKINAGLDMALFNERLSLTADVYQNTTTDMLDYIPASRLSGFDDVLVNDGEILTQGVDLGVNVQVLNQPLKWDLGLNMSSYTTEVKSINGDRKVTELFGAYVLTEVGSPLGVFYGYETNGVFATQAAADAADLYALLPNTSLAPFEAGDVHFVNTNPETDNVIDEQDRVVIGNPNPDFFGSVTSRMRWKGISLDALVSFSVGGDVYNYQRRQLESMNALGNQTTATLNRWRYDGQVTDVPRAVYGDENGNSRFSDRWIEDGSFVRLKNVTLGYLLPYKPLGIQSIEVFAAANNLLTFTDYKGLDPEFSAGGYSLVQGMDLGMVPQTRTLMLGVKIGL
ncbi:SusC/RagA family TonB-linked outer membrane protein [Geofilum rubicundum]|uniref:TonB-dependent receptor n=1 Tax=Geofilum rubicundum JCM 15548 TaxID=1236989 RepID=A0A0E9LX68_9BACT|nr:SusC/RagA family TonB-linked outer membrane protein [Geofilum rubicundum]GAO29445.1 TonB-dependent receptor [Geofilum rubicundum JCM 15548]